ncbi:hypothetical protein CS022_03075 [Veronia nyctiphanis]|uniref:Uncharacterized protein n=1 Tax=Veronia nyctiphanis TaxID=1278244 RepID=A0A4Q0YZC1_9GAMM|nr:hypothetical protein [Veronia nyctiphanis]RXJ74569.1 hypothetical protein CS022_03075 [Veronia nyctiphanis]
MKKTIEANQSENAYLPIIKPGDWVGVKHGAVRQTLIGTPENPMLVTAFGMETPDSFVFLMMREKEKLNLGKTVENAFDNLDALTFDVRLLPSLDNQGVSANAESFSSEMILSKKHMNAIHKLIGSQSLYVSIPRRSVFLAVSAEASEDVLNKFIYVHLTNWQDDSFGNPPITDKLFVVEEGEIASIVSLD